MDVANAIRTQNIDAPAGQIGQSAGRARTALSVAGRHPGPARPTRNNSERSWSRPARAPAAILRPASFSLRDVARVELGAQNYNQSCTFDGHPSVGLSIYQLPGTNALDVADRVRAKMEELKSRFPDGVEYDIAYDTTPYIRESVNEVFKTLRDAIILVGIVVLVFLQDWRAMILPMIDVPVSLIGTFAVMAAMGFSLNNLTLFGLVLAIGIVVDDAIVVLENTERMIAKGFDSRTATIKAMEEITGPIIAITLGAQLGVHPLLLYRWDHGPVLSPVRGDDRRLDDHLGRQRPDDDAVASRADFQDRGGRTRARAQTGGIPLVDLWYPRRPLDPLVRPRFLAGRFGLPPLAPELAKSSRQRLSWAATALYFAPGAWWSGWIGWLIIRPVNAVLGWLFRGFNRLFDGMTDVYGWTSASRSG